jgi:Mg2+ and Co2+ transporter CorA
VVTIHVHRNGRTEAVSSIDRAWLTPASGVTLWVDLAAPSIPESLILSDTFGFHPLSVEDAMSAIQYPKAEAYDGYLYVILHGIAFHKDQHRFGTHDVDFFLGPNYLVTVHDGDVQPVVNVREHAARNPKILGEGPVVLFHRIVDAMVDTYRPEIDKLEESLDQLEDAVFDNPTATLVQDRISDILDAHLSNVSNQLNSVMKVLTVVATIFMPLTLLSGLYGMNVPLPHFPGGETGQFWGIAILMFAVVVVMLVVFRRRRWI